MLQRWKTTNVRHLTFNQTYLTWDHNSQHTIQSKETRESNIHSHSRHSRHAENWKYNHSALWKTITIANGKLKDEIKIIIAKFCTMSWTLLFENKDQHFTLSSTPRLLKSTKCVSWLMKVTSDNCSDKDKWQSSQVGTREQQTNCEDELPPPPLLIIPILLLSEATADQSEMR